MPGALHPMARWPLHSTFPLLLVTLSSLLVNVAHGAVSWTATPFNPAAVPLAVRTPYLSCWLPQGAGTALNGAWPTFWTGSVCTSYISSRLSLMSISFRFLAGRDTFASTARFTTSWEIPPYRIPTMLRQSRKA